ncbi:hypothetical protein M8J76_009931 [Diaphorina citri]|nr:hypothetical protein M8J76_009931 [Diaphorina citri]
MNDQEEKEKGNASKKCDLIRGIMIKPKQTTVETNSEVKIDNQKVMESNTEAETLLSKLNIKSVKVTSDQSKINPVKSILKQNPVTSNTTKQTKQSVGNKTKPNTPEKVSPSKVKTKTIEMSKSEDKSTSRSTATEINTSSEITQDSEENTDFLRTTYNMIKINNPKLLASRAAKLNLVKQTLLNIENEKSSKPLGKDKTEKRCDDCGAPLSSGRDFIMHRDKCEVRQKKLEKILSGLKLPKSLQNTPQKDESLDSPTHVPSRIIINLSDRFESNESDPRPENITEDVEKSASDSDEPIPNPGDMDEQSMTESSQSNTSSASQKTPSKTNKSPFRSLYNLYDGLNREHIDIILNASRNERTLRSRPQEKEDKSEKSSKEYKDNNYEVEKTQNEIIITTRITGNVIERNTLIRPVQNDPNTTTSTESNTVDEAQANSRTLYETLKNTYQNAHLNTDSDFQEVQETPQPHRELISDCPQGLPRSANIKKLLKRNVLNPIRMKGPLLPDGKKFFRLDRKSFPLEKSKVKSMKKKGKLVKITSLLNNFIESPSAKKSTISKKKKFLKECQKDLKTSWQIEETEKRNDEIKNARAMRASNRSIRKKEDATQEETEDVLITEQSNVTNETLTPNEPQAQVVNNSEDEEEEEEEETGEEEQVVPVANLFIPYNFVSTVSTPSKETTSIDKDIEKTTSETAEPILADPKITETTQSTLPVESEKPDKPMSFSTPNPVSIVKQDLKRKSPGILDNTLLQTQPCLNSSQISQKTPIPHSKNTSIIMTPSTPKSKQQLTLKQEILEELRKLENRKWCDVCKKPFANNSTLNLHYSSLAHKRNVERSLFGGEDKKKVENKERKVRGRKKGSVMKKEITPETSEDEEVENMWCEEEEEEAVELSEEEKEEEPVQKKGRTRNTLSSSENSKDPPVDKPEPVKRARRSSTIDLERTLADNVTDDIQKENTFVQNKGTPQSSKNKGKMCTTCNVSFPSDVQLNKHYSSKMHKTAAALIADGKPKVCSVCKVSFTTNNQLHRHYTTQMHKTAAAKLVNELEGRGVIKTALFP